MTHLKGTQKVTKMFELPGCFAKVSKLAASSVRDKKPGIVLTCVLWVLLNIAAQAGVAMLGLTYSLNPAIDLTRPVLSFSNMSEAFGRILDGDSTLSNRLTAHTYGEMALQFTPVPLSILGVDNLDIIPNLAGYLSLVDFDLCLGPNSTTYMTYLETVDCGPRCAKVFVFENNGTSAYYHECAVNFSIVRKATVKVQQISDDHARLAAGAIARQGYQSAGNTNRNQFQQFPSQSTYGTFQAGSSILKADDLRKYAIGVVVVAEQILPVIDTTTSDATQVIGWVPQQGLILSIDHTAYMWAIFGSMAGAHLVLWIIGAYIASRVAVIENSFLKIALVLRPVTDELEEQGLLLGGHRHEHHALNGDVVYGPREEGEPAGVRALEISRVANCERVSKRWEGYYDP
ncbi:uncharacterized protein PAC_09285 [Phialocephala subalpina]|uniref:Uncharacterized protein n=1 Tax=Phialocephala subalpina TaxID=576137 RepID=A0A1L7X304_9HELO|nr:uncharacterized protein PAC_09285 [Phialocephala subalpina]